MPSFSNEKFSRALVYSLAIALTAAYHIEYGLTGLILFVSACIVTAIFFSLILLILYIASLPSDENLISKGGFGKTFLTWSWGWINGKLGDPPQSYWRLFLWYCLGVGILEAILDSIFQVERQYSLPIAVVAIIFLRFSRLPAESRLSSPSIAILTGLGTAALVFYGRIELLVLISSLSTGSINVISLISPSVMSVLSIALLFLFVTSQYPPVGIGVKIFLVGTIFGALLSLSLTYPVFTWVFENHTPGIFTPGDAHESIFLSCLLGSLLIGLILGPMTVFWAKPNTFIQKISLGALSGGIAGGYVFGFLGGSASGIIAQTLILPIVVTREGFEAETWVYRFAIAINNVLPWGVSATWLFIGAGILIGIFGALFIPIPTLWKKYPSIPSWKQLLTELTSPGLLLIEVLTFIVISAVYVILADKIQNTFDRMGVTPWPSPKFSLEIILLQHRMLILLLQALFVVWIYKRLIPYKKRVGNSKLLQHAAPLFVLIVLLLGSQISWVFFTDDSGLSMLFGLLFLAVSIEGMYGLRKLNTLEPQPFAGDPVSNEVPDEFPGQSNWHGASLPLGFLVAVLSIQFVFSAVSMALVAIGLISPLSNVNSELLGIQWLQEKALTPLIQLSSATFLLVLLSYMIISLSTRDPFVWPPDDESFSRPSIYSQKKRWKIIRDFVQKIIEVAAKTSIRTVLLGGLLLAGVVWQGSSTSLPAVYGAVVIFFLVAFLIVGDRLVTRLRLSAIFIAFLITFLALVALANQANPIPAWLQLIYEMALAFGGVIVYRAILVRASPKREIILRQLILIGVSILFVTIRSASEIRIQRNGGITSFDNQSWAIYDNASNLEESLVSGNVNYNVFQDSQGRLWFSSGIGSVIGKNNDRWNLYMLTTSEIDSPDLDKLRSFVFEDRWARLWVVSGNQFGLLALGEPNQENGQFVQRIEGTSLIVPTDSSGVPFSLNGSLRDAAQDADGNIWLITDDPSAIRFTPGNNMDPNSWDILRAGKELLSVYADRTGRIWFGTNQGPIAWEAGEFVAATPPVEASHMFSSMIFIEDTNGNLWVGTDKGLYRYSPDIVPAFQAQQGWPARVAITVFLEDSQGYLWAGANSGLYKYANQAWIEILPDVEVTSLLEDENKSIWVGTKQGLFKYIPASGSAVKFTSENSGLADNWVRDLLLDNRGVLWVSTYRQTTSSQPWPWAILATGVFFSALFVVARNGYEHSPETRGRRIGNRVLENPELLLPLVYTTVSTDSHSPEVLDFMGSYLEKNLDESGGRISRSMANFLARPDSRLDPLVESLKSDEVRAEAKSLSSVYEMASDMIRVRSIHEIADMGLKITISSQDTLVQIFAPRKLAGSLPSFMSPICAKVWRTFEEVGAVLRKYEQIGNAVDRVNYLVQVLDSLEAADKLSQEFLGPDHTIFQLIGDSWRALARDEITRISGQAELRLDLLTRQVRSAARMSIAMKLQNTGQAIAENIRIKFHREEELSEGETNQIRLERLSPGQSETVEFTLVDAKREQIRISCHLLWDDRQGSDHQYEFADIVKRYETSDKFELIPNPFIVGHPIKSVELFRGRRDIFDFILQNLNSATQHSRTLVLYGQRRTGKTSILYQLLGGRLGPAYVPVLIDVQELAPGINSTTDLFVELAYHIEKSMRKNGLTAVKADPTLFDAAPTRAFSRYLDEIENNLTGKKIVIMFDEFELIEERIIRGKLEPESLGYLRSLMQHKDYLAFIFTGTHKLEQMSKDYWSIFFNIALHQHVSFMNRDEAINLILEPVSGKLSIDDLVVDKTLMLTRGHPYFIQLLCWALVNYCNKNRRNYATLNDLNDVLQEIISSGDAYFAFVWQLATFDEKIIMAALAGCLGSGKNLVSFQEIKDALDRAGTGNYNKSKIIEILDRLVDREIIMPGGSDGLQYSYRVGLIGEWVKNSKPLRALAERGS